ncbi:hypothetical protein [Ornithinimicrobium cavernae]|uniref:hypothetical protein n=1 Tax=Ornithinimicrobium cavernae TaxID=2666047 RepID=UPI000D69D37F|nr:hypothetical protein [Ornithinimicrobium cavernae]
MSDTTQGPTEESGQQDTGRDDSQEQQVGADETQDVPSTEQDVASGQPYDPRQDPGPSGRPERPGEVGGSAADREQSDATDAAPYDPDEDPDADPDMLQERSPAARGVNRRDPAEGPDDESADT